MLNDAIRKYYADYYGSALGIPGYERNVESRLHEDDSSKQRIVSKLSFIHSQIPSGGKVLIVGGGTGAELVAFHSLGFEAWMIEPEEEALNVARQKAVVNNIDERYIVGGVAEKMPFDDSYFDLIWSFTVLEHVQDYRLSLSEICRVMRSGAWGTLFFPDYRCIYEAHYKMYMPLFLPKLLNALFLRLKGRNPEFFMKHTNKINHQKFIRTAMNLPIDTFRHYQPIGGEWRSGRTLMMSLAYFMKMYFDIEYSLSYFIRRR